MNVKVLPTHIGQVGIVTVHTAASDSLDVSECIHGQPAIASSVPIVLRAVQELLLTQFTHGALVLVHHGLQGSSGTEGPGR